MDRVEIEEYLKLLDGRGSDNEFSVVKELSCLGMEFPKLLLEKYRGSKKWGERASCLYHASKYVVSSPHAFELGIEALGDKSKVVRYRACLLLAMAQKSEAIKPLGALITNSESSDDAKAAIDAIEHKNHHYIADRDHSGMATLNVEQKYS
ncbi:hypothetical protein L4174_020540 [Photobacterium sp. CCB-ST2H9]|uniref:HEAT repeat domain-containing protein n=1 Tax=Photobacterium sp. CCB-ST2H9 TaxID=2912855 RepID=UPI00200629B8|nr:HEAT repeat domain-containing protein [Photobacterium sp. CCB-ST2H9]UTM59104.1 hypothetical protein L4174_020540 [Photobacterium sp. CCB-ST2H9]